jgi:uncharacterized protein (TIGR02246 family)
MKTLATVWLVLLSAAPTIAADAVATGKDAEAIRKSTEDFFAAWNRKDIPGLVSRWTADATLLDPTGRVAHGRAELETMFAEAHAAAGDTVERLVSFSARFIRKDLAWVDVNLTVDNMRGADGAAMPQVKYHLVGLVQKVGGQWLWSEGRPYPLMPLTPPPAGGAGK